MFSKLFNSFWRICLLKKGPEEVPYSLTLLLVVIFTNICFVSLILFLSDRFESNLYFFLGVQYLGLAGFLYFLLRLFHKPARFVQTYTAMSGCELLITVIQFMFVYPLVLMNASYPNLLELSADIPSYIRLAYFLLSILMFFSMIWKFVVYAKIFKETLDVTWIRGFLFTIAMILFYSLIMSQLFIPEGLVK